MNFEEDATLEAEIRIMYVKFGLAQNGIFDLWRIGAWTIMQTRLFKRRISWQGFLT